MNVTREKRARLQYFREQKFTLWKFNFLNRYRKCPNRCGPSNCWNVQTMHYQDKTFVINSQLVSLHSDLVFRPM